VLAFFPGRLRMVRAILWAGETTIRAVVGGLKPRGDDDGALAGGTSAR